MFPIFFKVPGPSSGGHSLRTDRRCVIPFHFPSLPQKQKKFSKRLSHRLPLQKTTHFKQFYAPQKSTLRTAEKGFSFPLPSPCGRPSRDGGAQQAPTPRGAPAALWCSRDVEQPKPPGFRWDNICFALASPSGGFSCFYSFSSFPFLSAHSFPPPFGSEQLSPGSPCLSVSIFPRVCFST